MRKIITLLSLTLVCLGAFSQHDHSNKTNNNKIQASINIGRSTSTSAIIDNYLSLKDALVKEDSKSAASSGEKLIGIFSKFNASEVAGTHKKGVAKIIENASQQSKLISENSENIGKQREYFEFLTNNVKDLILITGSDRALYQAYCPMYNNNKGGAWLSTSKEISNPYFGSKMLKCGSVQQEISVK